MVTLTANLPHQNKFPEEHLMPLARNAKRFRPTSQLVQRNSSTGQFDTNFSEKIARILPQILSHDSALKLQVL